MKHGLNSGETNQKCAREQGGFLERSGHQQRRNPGGKLNQKSKGNLKRHYEDP